MFFRILARQTCESVVIAAPDEPNDSCTYEMHPGDVTYVTADRDGHPETYCEACAHRKFGRVRS